MNILKWAKFISFALNFTLLFNFKTLVMDLRSSGEDYSMQDPSMVSSGKIMSSCTFVRTWTIAGRKILLVRSIWYLSNNFVQNIVFEAIDCSNWIKDDKKCLLSVLHKFEQSLAGSLCKEVNKTYLRAYDYFSILGKRTESLKKGVKNLFDLTIH